MNLLPYQWELAAIQNQEASSQQKIKNMSHAILSFNTSAYKSKETATMVKLLRCEYNYVNYPATKKITKLQILWMFYCINLSFVRETCAFEFSVIDHV